MSSKPAVFRTDSREQWPSSEAYNIKDYVFDEAINPYLHGDWEDFDRRFKLKRGHDTENEHEGFVVYRVAEHTGDPKLPNFTKIFNVPMVEPRELANSWTVFGCTAGRYHWPALHGPCVRQVYEFESYGMVTIDRETDDLELWVVKAGDKVAIPDGCHATIYNLDEKPLIISDFANSRDNSFDDNLVKLYGPVLLTYYSAFEAVFTLNRLYINNPFNVGGVSLDTPRKKEQDRQVRIDRSARLALGRFLYENLTRNPETIAKFARLGISIKKASPEVVLYPLPTQEGSRLFFSLPLMEASKKGTDVYRYFFPNANPAHPTSRVGEGIATIEAKVAKEKEQLIKVEPLNRELIIVVEGCGEWVKKTFRHLFWDKKREGAELAVYYVDDTRWTQGQRPDWAEPANAAKDSVKNVEDSEKEMPGKLDTSWETYLDKADPDHFDLYKTLTPDVVFIITPDYTHSEIASSWLGKASLVFVEKPFDSHLDNVFNLLRECGRQRNKNTRILGLDHYLFYALPVHQMINAIEGHLDGALEQVVFYMTEERPIELKRVRTLQYGLTLDLLPHFLALLTYFGDIRTIDNIRVLEAARYYPLIAKDPDEANAPEVPIAGQFHNETFSAVRFTFQDYSGNGYHVPCLAVVGKGCSQDVKYLEATGLNGSAIRVDLKEKPKTGGPSSYPWSSLFYIQGELSSPSLSNAIVREVQDPYRTDRTLNILAHPDDPEQWDEPGRYRPSLDRKRYGKLIDDLLGKPPEAAASTLQLSEAEAIVRALDCIWRAIQTAKPYSEYYLNQMDPFRHETQYSPVSSVSMIKENDENNG